MSRLAIAHTESSCGWGGQEIRVIEESLGFLSAGHQVTIAAPAEARITAEARKRGIPVSELPIARKRPRGFWAMRKFLASQRFDIVNTHSSTDSWLAALATRAMSVPPKIVRTRHVSATVRANLPTRWLYANAAQVVTTGERLRRQLIDALALPQARVTSVPTGIDLTRFLPGDAAAARASVDLPAGAFIVGIVATLRSWKGHRYLIDALAALRDTHAPDRRIVLAIVGDGPGRVNIAQQVRELGLESMVVCPGNQENVVTWMRAFDVFVLPSYANEGVPQALMQAMACGCPVITTPVGSIEEIVEHGRTGWLVPPRDVEALRDALVLMMDESMLRKRLAASALDQARERFSSQRMIEGMERIFSAALS